MAHAHRIISEVRVSLHTLAGPELLVKVFNVMKKDIPSSDLPLYAYLYLLLEKCFSIETFSVTQACDLNPVI